MSKSIIVSERDNIAAVMENNKVSEFYIHRGDILMGDVYLAKVENILPSIDAAFVNVGSDRMGFLHASDVTGKGSLQEKLKPNQKVIIQVVKEPTGHKGPRVTMQLSLPGRFLVLMPGEKGINLSRKIESPKERARLKSIVSLLKPAGVGIIIRTEAENQSESEIQEDIEFLLEKWNGVITAADTLEPPNLLYRDQDLLYRVIREACSEEVKEIIVDTPFALHRTNQLLQSWNMDAGIDVSVYKGTEAILVSKGIEKEIRVALQTKVNMPSGGYLFIQTTEALTVIDVNSGKFTSSATQSETIRKINLEAVGEIARQLKLRNIGGMIIVDFIDMESRIDKLSVLEALENAVEKDKAKPQIGQLSDLGLVEMTRHRQGQSLAEIFQKKCPACSGTGLLLEEFNFASPTNDIDFRTRQPKIKSAKQIVQKQPQVQQAKPQEKEQRVIKTTPSLIASAELKQTAKVHIGEKVKMNGELIRAFIAELTFVPAMSELIRLNSISSHLMQKHMKHAPIELFTMLNEIQTSQPTETPKKIIQPTEQMQFNIEAKVETEATKEITAQEEAEVEEKPEKATRARKTTARKTTAKAPAKTVRKPRKKAEE